MSDRTNTRSRTGKQSAFSSKKIAAKGRTSFLGCLTCRFRRVKCDECHPTCARCSALRLTCEWPGSSEPGQSNLVAAKPRKPTIPRLEAPNQGLEVPKPKTKKRSSNRTRILAYLLPNNMANNSYVGNIPPALPVGSMTCANSMTLSPYDRVLLEYFPSSTIWSFYSFGDWGTMRYVFENTAPSSRIVMLMMLALSATELSRNGHYLSGNWRRSSSQVIDYGLHYYNLAICGLQSLVEEKDASGTDKSPEAVIGAIFFMMHYEFFFTSSVDRIRMHLAGLWAVIRTHPIFSEEESPKSIDRKITTVARGPSLSISSQLILWFLSAPPVVAYISKY
jgi:hypothetical protein